MSNETNIYDLLIAVIPSIIIGSISTLTIIISNKNNNKDQITSLKISKIEKLYQRLLNINGEIKGEINNYKNDRLYFSNQNNINRITKDIDLLKVEAQLYIGIDWIDAFSSKAQELLNQIVSKGISISEKKNLNDGTYEEEEDGINWIVPNTFDKYYDMYENVFNKLEDEIVSLAQINIGINSKKVKKVNRRRKDS